MGVFKAYDIRGVYGKELTDEFAYKVGRAIVKFLGCEKIVWGGDMRISTPALKNAFVRGAAESGCDVLDMGMVCSDAVYFASGKLSLPGVMITASHNPAEYNGLKFCKAGAHAFGIETGLGEVQKLVELGKFENVELKGTHSGIDLLKDYVSHVRKFIDADKLKPLKIAADAGNGMAGKVLPMILEGLPVELVPLYFELDGSFPNHPANPAMYENLKELQKTVAEGRCDFGVAFDGDADRVVFVDENGTAADASLISAVIAEEMLRKNPGESVVYNLVCSNVVPETVTKAGGKAICEKVGHSYIKSTMRKYNAVFGCEASAHYYYRDNYFADSAMITLLVVAGLISREGKKLSELISKFKKYSKIEETNLKVEDKQGVIEGLKKYFSEKNPVSVSETDGLRVDFDDWWFCVRPSNTEPFLRLNLEAKSEQLMNEKTEEIIKIIG